MSDYIDRQAAIDAIEKLILPQVKGETAAEEINRVAWRFAINCAEKMIGHLPSADVVPVVRCKDCKHRLGDYCHNDDGFAHFDRFFVQMDDYCSRGARMDGGEDETAEADYEWSEEEQAYIEQGYMDTQVGVPDLYMN